LPRGWSILHYLARLEHELLQQLVRDGVVHQELTLREAKALVRRRGRPRPATTKRPKVGAIVSQFSRFVGDTLPEWSVSQLQFARSRLRELLQRIDAARSKNNILLRNAGQMKNKQSKLVSGILP
jgi:hypothetical protein